MEEKTKVITLKKRTFILLAVFFVLLIAAVGVTAGFVGRTAAAEETNVYINANPAATELSASEKTIVELVESVSDTVVEITTSEVTTGSYMQQSVKTGAGSGVVIDGAGYIITNHHVISGADTIRVRTTDGTEYDAALIAGDAFADIAVIRIQPEKALPAATFANSDLLKVGQTAVAIGNPLGSLGGTVTEGIISATNRAITVDGVTMTLLQTSAAINPGNSGGGLFSLSGELIGIVNAKSSGSDIEGLGFAIPSNTALDAAKQLLEQGYISGRADFGFTVVEVTDMFTAMANGLNRLGVYVSGVSSAYGGELKPLDCIYSVNGTLIASAAQMTEIVSAGSVGDTVEIVYYRGNEKRTETVALVQYDPENYA